MPMNLYKSTFILFFALSIFLIPLKSSFAGASGTNRLHFSQTDAGAASAARPAIIYFFDLRERETYLQLTYPAVTNTPSLFEFTNSPARAHIQIYDVSNNCNENDFFDVYTPQDTHIYNMRDIQTNDGNPSGVVLPEGAYGIVTIVVESEFGAPAQAPFGNMRIIDNNGYEYRTNAQTKPTFGPSSIDIDSFDSPFYSFNFNKESEVTLSDVVGVTHLRFTDDNLFPQSFTDASDVANIFNPVDVDIVDNTENIFSCRNVIFSCVDQDNPRLEELLENAGSASVASFEYGINNEIPHSKGGELLCPGNTIDEGLVKLTPLKIPQSVLDTNSSKPGIGGPGIPFFGFIGLNNGNGRGSFDSFWFNNFELVISS